MAVNDFTIRVSGTVAYSDNSHGSFEASAIWNTSLGSVIAQHSSADSQLHFGQLYADETANVSNTLSVLPGNTSLGDVTLTPPAPVSNKLVTSFVMEVSGLVTDDSNSHSSFVAQWIDGIIDLYPSVSVPAWTSLNDGTVPGANSLLIQVFEALAGTGNVSITT